MSDDYQPDLDVKAWQHVRAERPTEWQREQTRLEAERLADTDLHSAWEQRQAQRELRDDNQGLRDDILQLGARVLALEAALAAVRGSLGNPAPHVEDGPVSLTNEAASAPPHKE